MNNNNSPSQQRPPRQNQTQGTPTRQRPQGVVPHPQQRQMQRPPQRPRQVPYADQRRTQRTVLGEISGRSKILAISLMALLALLVISIIVLVVVLAIGDGKTNDNDDVEGTNDPIDSSSSQTPPASSQGQGGVATNASRNNYIISLSGEYATIEGITSGNAVLIDRANYSVVAAKAANERICPASMTKVMTVLIACENIRSLNDVVTVTQEAVNYQAEHGASGYGLEAGEKVSVKDLLYLIYYRSDTVACLMISEYVAGSEAEFVKLMNNKVKSMGLTNTYFANSTGLYFEGNEYYTTCLDMAARMSYALENSLARQILTSTGGYYLSTSKHNGEMISPGWRVDGGRLGKADIGNVTIKGGKTGFETISGSCLVTYAVSDSGKQYIQVIVGGEGVNNSKGTVDVKYIYNTYAN